MTAYYRLTLALLLVFLCVGCERWDTSPSITVKGQVLLEQADNHEGTRVYIPGTARVAFTDNQGRFVLDGLSPGKVEMVLDKEGYSPERRPLNLQPGDSVFIRQPIELSREDGDEKLGGVRGRIVLQEKDNPAETLVLAKSPEMEASNTANATGEFTLAGLLPGKYLLYFFRPEYITYRRNIEVQAGEDVEVGEISLNKGLEAPASEPVVAATSPLSGTALKGKVLLAEQGDHSGVLVSVPGTSYLATSDEQGNYEIRGLPPGEYRLAFQKTGFEPAKAPAVTLRSGVIQGVDQVTLQRRLSDQTTGEVQGFVQEEGGYATNLGGYEVSLKGNLSYQTTTEPSGKYVFTNVDPGVYRLTVTGEGIETYEMIGVQVRPGERTEVPKAVLTLEEIPVEDDSEATGSKLMGTALLDGKKNHAGIMVSIEGTNLLQSTDARGEYVFYDVPSGLYRVHLNADGYRGETIEGVQISAGQSVTLGPVTLYEERESPYVLYTEPSDGASDVPVDAYIDVRVVFSNRMDGASVKRAVSIEPAVSYRTFFGGEHPESGVDRLLIQLQRSGDPPLKFNEEYTITIGDSAEDVYGTRMDEPYRFSITTSGPRIVSTYPEDGADGIIFLVDDFILINFNSTVQYENFLNAVNISPKPETQPLVMPGETRAGSQVKIRLSLKPDTSYRVNISSRARTLDGDRFENTPYSFSFTTGRIKGMGDPLDNLILYPEDQQQRQ
jgi:hypothetical protein